MAAAMRIALLAVAAMAVLSTASAATTYNVGAPSGAWDLRTDYGTWVSDKKFLTGDSIVFKYTSPNHDVLEVSKADYDSCSNASPIASFNSGDDTIALSTAGTRYFICGVAGHCTGGMKVTIDVGSGSGSTPSPPAPPANGPSASSPPSPPSPSSAATSVRVTAGFGLVVLLAGLMA